jgi:hypothetical protein
MNERIKEFAEQANNHAEQTISYYMGQFNGLTWENKIKQTRDQKFAELIAQECIDVAFHHGDNVDYLKQHFGIES